MATWQSRAPGKWDLVEGDTRLASVTKVEASGEYELHRYDWRVLISSDAGWSRTLQAAKQRARKHLSWARARGQ